MLIVTFVKPTSLFIQDSFSTGADGDDLNSRSGELNASWTRHPHANYTGTPARITGAGRVYADAAAPAAYYASGVPASADYFVEADFHHISTITQNAAVTARMDTTADTMYLARLDSGTIWQVRRIVGGSSLTIGSSTNQLPSSGNFKTGRLVVQGDQISFYINGVLEIGPITDTNISAAGRAGIRIAGNGSSTTGFHLDNFAAGV